MTWFNRLRNHVRSDDVSREIEREMEFHIEERIDELVARGMNANAARREARRRFGNLGGQRERTRERDVFAFLDTMFADVRYAIRGLRAAPAFAAVTVASLGLGVGANTAIFTLVDAVLLKTLPVQRPEELVMVTRGTDSGGDKWFTNPLWEAVRDRQSSLQSTAAYSPTSFNLANGGEARLVEGTWVSGDFFQMLGVQPIAGRLLGHTDDQRGCPALAAISARFWQSEFGGRDNVVGKTVSIEGKPVAVIGVVDERFSGVDVGRQSDIYLPLCADPVLRGSNRRLEDRATWYLHVMARPKAGLTPAQVAAQLATISPEIAQATLPRNWPAEATARYLRTRFGTEPAAGGFSQLRSRYERALWVLMAIVGLVLLIACANVANLLLARAAAREREMAVRLALGAGRGRIARQLLTESVFLSLLGALAGMAFAMWGTRVLVRMLSTTTSVVSLDLSADGRVLAFTIAVAMVTGILFGLAPAWRSRQVDPQSAMKAYGRGVVSSRFGVGKALVVAQVAVSLVLVTGAALLLGSWRRLATVDPGFRSEGVVVMEAILPATSEAAHRGVLFRQVLDRLRTMPGVQSAAAAELTPIGSSSWNNVIDVAGFTAKSEDDSQVWMNEVTDAYFATMGTPFLEGRDFDARDVPSSPKVAIVSETMARRFFGSASPLGRTFRVQAGTGYGPSVTIVGVVKDSKYLSMREDRQAIAFFARGQNADVGRATTFAIRAQSGVASIIPPLRSVLAELAPRARLDITTLDGQIFESLQLPRTLATLSGFFGSLALLLATIGLYGIMSYSVARRRNEIGVRIALGAARGRVVRMVLAETSRMVVAGVVVGTLLAVAGSRLVTAFLYGVTPSDPVTLAASAGTLILVGLAAAALPAARAARLDPVTALRED